MFHIASDLRFAIPITNRGRNRIARFGAFSANRTATGLENRWPQFETRDLSFESLCKSPLESQCRFVVEVVRVVSFSEKVHVVSNR